MYKYICIVMLVLVMKGQSSIITLANKPVLVSNTLLKPESELEITWESHIMDFVQLIDMQKLMNIGIHYLSDEEVLNFIVFLSSEQFREILFELESMTEFKEAVTYLASKGYDVTELVDYINSAFGLARDKKLNIDVKYRKGVSGLIEDLVETLPLEDIKKLFESKLVNHPEIADLFKTIQSEEFLEIIKRLSQNPKFKNYKTIFESYGVDFSQICTIAAKIFDKPKDLRKHYGLSFHINCKDYVKTFKCMSACKSIGYQVFRMNYRCKCTCHEMKTSTVLPFFKWRTNGTTRSLPKTRSPKLYHIVGTLSPPSKPDSVETTIDTTLADCNVRTSTYSSDSKDAGDTTGSPGSNNTTEVEAAGATSQDKSDNATNAAPVETTVAKA